MYDPISVETALVSSGGDLLIQLTDGTIVNAGRVRGMPGPQGEQGEQGIRGAHGKDGIDGTNGAKWHTGVGAPELSVGENGDMYMDVASALLPIFQKVNGDWMFLANLKVPPSGGGGGQAGAAGGGGSVILYPMPDGGTPPTNDNDGKPVDKGDIWLDINTGWLWVYDGNNWIPVADRPPVIISPTPPEYNNAGEGTTQYPVREGDLWFDSDQLGLYVAATNIDDELVWIISTPANRSGLTDVVNPFKFPRAIDGETAYNPLTDTYYVYNEPKKQWIDLPKNCYIADYLLSSKGDTLTYGQFKLWSDDGNTSVIVVYGDRTPFYEVGNTLTINDIVYTIEEVIYDAEDNETYIRTNPSIFNDNSLNIGETYTFSTCDPVTDKEEVYYGETPPVIANDGVEEGDLWVDSDDNKMYVWDGNTWSEVTACGGPGGDGAYLLRHGHNVDDCAVDPVFDWNKPVRFGTTQGFSKSFVSVGTDQIVIDSHRDIDVDAASGQLRIEMDTGTLGIGSAHIMNFTYDGILYHETITEPKEITTKEYVDARVKNGSSYVHTVLQFYSSSSSLNPDDAAFYWASTNGSVLYRKGAAGRILPELKVGDGFRVIKQDGSVLSLKVTAVNGMAGDFFNVTTTILSPGVSLVNGEVYDVNFVFH